MHFFKTAFISSKYCHASSQDSNIPNAHILSRLKFHMSDILLSLLTRNLNHGVQIAFHGQILITRFAKIDQSVKSYRVNPYASTIVACLVDMFSFLGTVLCSKWMLS